MPLNGVNSERLQALLAFNSTAPGYAIPGVQKVLYQKPRFVSLQTHLSNPKMQGAFVKHIQEMLIQAGFSLQANGIFDNNTQKAMVQFQQKHQLDADGIVGVDTTKTLR